MIINKSASLRGTPGLRGKPRLSALSLLEPEPSSMWILELGAWNDAGVWLDGETWNDAL